MMLHGMTTIPARLSVGDIYPWARSQPVIPSWALKTEKVPLVSVRHGKLVDIPNKVAVFREDDTYLGVVGTSQRNVQPEKQFEALTRIVGAVGHRIEAIGMLRGGTNFVATLKMDPVDILPGDSLNPFVIVTDNYIGEGSWMTGRGSVAIYCKNYEAMARKELFAGVKGLNNSQLYAALRHTKNLEKNIEAKVRKIEQQAHETKEVISAYRAMARKSLTPQSWGTVLDAVVGPVPEEEGRARTTRIATRERLTDLLEGEGRGSHVRGTTLWGAFNAVSEYTTHEIPVRGVKKVAAAQGVSEDALAYVRRMENSLLGGAGGRMNVAAGKVLMDIMLNRGDATAPRQLALT